MKIYTLRPDTFTLNFNFLFQVRQRRDGAPPFVHAAAAAALGGVGEGRQRQRR